MMMTENPPMDNTWRTRAFERGTIVDHAQRFAQRIEEAGLEVYSRESDPMHLAWPEVVQAFSNAADDAVDEAIRRQREKAAYIDAQKRPSESPEEAQGCPHHKPAIMMIVHYLDGSHHEVDMRHELIQRHGWKTTMLNGVPFLIIGHGVPRQQIPLTNVRIIDLLTEDDL